MSFGSVTQAAMSFDQVIPVAIVLMSGVAVQAAVGFGAGLFSVPLLIWLEVPLPVAVGLVMSMVVVQGVFSCWQHRDELPWRLVMPVFLGAAWECPWAWP